jgi:zinc-binding in reverse transcriptase
MHHVFNSQSFSNRRRYSTLKSHTRQIIFMQITLQILTDTPLSSEHIVSTWKLQVPPRILIFIWLMFKNKILTVDNLQRKELTMVIRCALYRNHEESVPHLFHSCSFFRQSLLSTLQSINQYSQFFTILEILHQLYLWIQSSHIPKQVRETILLTSFVIWRKRCSRNLQKNTKLFMI